ncbi:MAG: hypothetical protein PHW31_01910 [Candidatus Pacebacteria bacterium]|nr:hypothetical protein [Candidatus Paceibacterota bacterium]
MKKIIELIVKRAGERIFRVPGNSFGVINLQDDIWVIKSEGVSLTGEIYPSEASIIFEITEVEGERQLIGFKYGAETREEAIKKAGQEIFHTSPAALYVTNPEDNIWVIEFEGVAVSGKAYPDSTQESQIIFEVIKIEGERKLVGLKFTI